jgi:hypothetical protein
MCLNKNAFRYWFSFAFLLFVDKHSFQPFFWNSNPISQTSTISNYSNMISKIYRFFKFLVATVSFFEWYHLIEDNIHIHIAPHKYSLQQISANNAKRKHNLLKSILNWVRIFQNMPWKVNGHLIKLFHDLRSLRSNPF